MKYTRLAQDRAEEELSQRRKNAYDLRQRHLDEISQIIPEVIQLNNTILGANFEMLKAVTEKTKNVSASDAVMKIKEHNKQAHKRTEELLVENGYPADYLKFKYTCEKCNDYGFSNGVRCECMTELLKKYTIEELSKNCFIKLHSFDEFRLDLYPETDENGHNPREKMRQNLNGCIGFVNNFEEINSSLLMLGNTGLGKTFMCSCIANSLLNKGYNVIFSSVLKIFSDIEAEHFNRKKGDTLNQVINADLLILDDLGSEFKSPFFESVLYEVVNDRINMCKPTIVSTNLSSAQLNQNYNERIVSRLVGYYKPLLFIGKDIRFELRGQNF